MNTQIYRPSSFLLGFLLILSFEVSALPPNANPIAMEKVREDLVLLREEKLSRTPAQQKMASVFVTHLRKQRGDPKALALPDTARGFGPKFIRDDIVQVDIKGEITERLIDFIKTKGGVVIAAAPEYKLMSAEISISALEAIAELEEVRSILPMTKSMPQKDSVSEGDAAHAAPEARSFFAATGEGVKVGVISDSVKYLQDVQASGDLPEVTVLSDYPGGTGEGTAMLEIVHDLAPDAELLFATGFPSTADLANAIQLLTAAGADIIVDDLFSFSQSPFQDDVIAQAAEDAISSGVFYFTSAGNYGNLNDGTASVFEGDYNPSGGTWQTPDYLYESVHVYPDSYAGNQVLNSGNAHLFWSDPLGGSSNDYDLLFYDSSGNFVAASTNIQNGSQNPYESSFGSEVPAGWYIVIAKFSGENRFIHLSMTGLSEPQLTWGTSGYIRGQGGAERVITVAATSAQNRTVPFDGTESVETFSSDGHRRVFYDRFGNPYTPGNYSSTGGLVRLKPDVTAADGVDTSTPGFSPFFGTSAAAPHAAAIGALLLSARPDMTIDEIAAVDFGELDIEAPGRDRDSGEGIFMATNALDAITTVPDAPVLTSAEATASGQVTMAFNPPLDDGGIPISGYTGKCDSVTTQGDASPLVISGLTDGQGYSCSVAASNAKGLGAYSDAIDVLLSEPPTPDIIKTDYDDGVIYLYVSVSDDGSPEPTLYTASCSDGENVYVATASSSPITIDGLVNDVAYTCSVTATNIFGTSDSSSLTNPIVPGPKYGSSIRWMLFQMMD